MRDQEVGKRQLRSFGLLVGGGFAVIAFWPMAFGAAAPRTWALVPAVLLAVAALAIPAALKQPFRLWMAIGAVLAWVNTRVILGVVYYVMFVPMALFFRATGRDPMRRGFDTAAETYRIPRTKRPASHMQRQY